MFTDKIQKLMTLGTEAALLSSVSQIDEPYLKVIWRKDGLLDLEFYSYSLELGSNSVGNHSFTVIDITKLEELLDQLISIAEREITALSRKDSGSGCS